MALLWSIRRTARLPGDEDRLRWPGGSHAPDTGPSKSAQSCSLCVPSRSETARSAPRRPSRCLTAS
eukprot:6416421-Alexandrium_andersonii.AAC.1